jgi:hypothetical protein
MHALRISRTAGGDIIDAQQVLLRNIDIGIYFTECVDQVTMRNMAIWRLFRVFLEPCRIATPVEKGIKNNSNGQYYDDIQ